MKKIIKCILLSSILCSAVLATPNTNETTYVAVRGGVANTNIESIDPDQTSLIVYSVGKFFRGETIAVELELSHQRFTYSVNEVSVVTNTETTTATQSSSSSTKPNGCKKPGKGRGGWWHHNHPDTVLTSDTTTTTSSTTEVLQSSRNVDVSLTYVMANVVYRHVTDSNFTPYGLVGIGLSYLSFNNETSDTAFMYQLGLGIDIELTSALSTDIGCRYVSDFYESDFDIEGVNVVIGLTYQF